MEMTPHVMAIRYYAGKLHISVITTPGQKTFYLLNLPYYLVSQIENYLHWFEEEIKKIIADYSKMEMQ